MNASPVKRLTTLQGHSVLEFSPTLDLKGAVTFASDMDIDGDGVDAVTGLPNKVPGDTYYQPRTSLKQDGQYLDATRDKYMVVPGQEVMMVHGVVLGCQGLVVDLRTGKWSWTVVGDTGPTTKDGEASIATAQAIGVPSSPVNGGVDGPNMFYAFWPGKAAYVDGKSYTLQPS